MYSDIDYIHDINYIYKKLIMEKTKKKVWKTLCVLITACLLFIFAFAIKTRNDKIESYREQIDAVFTGRADLFYYDENITEQFIAKYSEDYKQGNLMIIIEQLDEMMQEEYSLIYY